MADARPQPADVIRDAVTRQRQVREGIVAAAAAIRAEESGSAPADAAPEGQRQTGR